MTKIWVVTQLREDGLHRMSREAIAAGQKLAAEVGGSVSAVVLGSGVEAARDELAALDLEAVLVADDASLAAYTPGAYVGVLAPAIRAAEVGYVVFPHTYQSVDYVARLSQEVDAAFVPEVTAFAQEDGELVWSRPVMGGKLQSRVRVKGEGTVFVSVQSGVFSADEAAAGSAHVKDLGADFSQVEADRRILGVEQVGGDHVDLSKADVVIAVGRGVGGEDKLGPIRELAAKLGAEIGASRPVIDNGWLPRDRQIGSSGQTVAPKLYFAIGISGAIQHLVGMKGAGCVVSINKDASAPIFSVSRYAVLGDLHEVVPALNKALAEAGI